MNAESMTDMPIGDAGRRAAQQLTVKVAQVVLPPVVECCYCQAMRPDTDGPCPQCWRLPCFG